MNRIATMISLTALGLTTAGCPPDCRDADGDGYAAGDDYCLAPMDLLPGDCDDNDAAMNPEDRDHDGISSCDGDCDDLDDTIHPGADDLACDGIDNDCDGDDPTALTVESILPADGATDVHPRPAVVVEFDGHVDHLDATAVWTAADGSAVELEGIVQGRHAVFTPVDAVLDARTDYEVAVTVGCMPDVTWDVTTGDVGDAVAEEAIDGTDYLLALGESWLALPIAVDELLPALLEDSLLALHVSDLGDGAIAAFSAVVEEDGADHRQDLCLPTSTWGDQVPGPAAWTNPHLSADGFPLWLTVDTGHEVAPLRTESTLAAATVAPGGDSLTNVWIDTAIDADDLAELIYGESTEIEDTCLLFSSLGLACELCPDDDRTCVQASLLMADAPATTVTGTHPDSGEPLTTLIEVTEADIERWTDAGICPGD